MKFKVTFKDPDGVYESLDEAAEGLARDVVGVDDEERGEIAESRREKIKDFTERWIEYGEYLTVEFDTDEGTATVVPVK